MQRRYRVVFHINTRSLEPLDRAISNIYNLLAAVGEENVEAVVVANGDAVEMFTRDALDERRVKRIEKLSARGVKFLVCRNSLRVKGIPESMVCSACDVVDAAITLLVRLQNEGYAYIKP